MEKIFNMMITRDENSGDKTGVSACINVIIGGHTTMCPVTSIYTSYTELKSEVEALHNELDDLLDEPLEEIDLVTTDFMTVDSEVEPSRRAKVATEPLRCIPRARVSRGAVAVLTLRLRQRRRARSSRSSGGHGPRPPTAPRRSRPPGRRPGRPPAVRSPGAS